MSAPSCAACVRRGRMCSLCEAGLKPMPGLNDDLICELEGLLARGAHDAGKRPGESVLGYAARVVRENRSHDLETSLRPEEVRAIALAQSLSDLGLCAIVSWLDGKPLSARVF